MAAQPSTREAEDRWRLKSCGYLSIGEGLIYILLALLLGCTALVGLFGAAHLLWSALLDWTGTRTIFLLIDRLLFVLMLLEILHTVRISLQSHMLVVEPFLIVGLIASIRRLLVLTLQAEALTGNGHWTTDGSSLFHASMIELGVLSGVVAVLVVSIFAMRSTRPAAANEELAAFLPENY